MVDFSHNNDSSSWNGYVRYSYYSAIDYKSITYASDSLDGDPITHLEYSALAHAHAARSLCRIAEEYCEGRILGLGGGGYNRTIIAKAWTAVVKAFLDAPQASSA